MRNRTPFPDWVGIVTGAFVLPGMYYLVLGAGIGLIVFAIVRRFL